jgi:hypothetical protein
MMKHIHIRCAHHHNFQVHIGTLLHVETPCRFLLVRGPARGVSLLLAVTRLQSEQFFDWLLDCVRLSPFSRRVDLINVFRFGGLRVTHMDEVDQILKSGLEFWILIVIS